MPNRTIYFYADTYEVIKEKQDKKEVSKYINDLIRNDEQNLRDLGESVNGTVSNTVTAGSIPVSPAILEPRKNNPNSCKKCGHIKVSGKCINKDCK